jgi:hypothetical protein
MKFALASRIWARIQAVEQGAKAMARDALLKQNVSSTSAITTRLISLFHLFHKAIISDHEHHGHR